MAYWFSGFFAKPAIGEPDELPEGAIWREIVAPSAVGGRAGRAEHGSTSR